MIVNESPRLLDVVQASKRLRVCTATVRRRIAKGELRALRIGHGGPIRIPETEVDRLLVPYERERIEGEET